jgi:hypothetical protein
MVVHILLDTEGCGGAELCMHAAVRIECSMYWHTSPSSAIPHAQDVLTAMVDVSHMRPRLLVEPHEPEVTHGQGLSALLPGWVSGGQSKTPESTSPATQPLPEQTKRAHVTQEVTLLGTPTESSSGADDQEAKRRTGDEDTKQRHELGSEAPGIAPEVSKQACADLAGLTGQLSTAQQGMQQTIEDGQLASAEVLQPPGSQRASSDGGQGATVLRREASFYVPKLADNTSAEPSSGGLVAAVNMAGQGVGGVGRAPYKDNESNRDREQASGIHKEASFGHTADASEGPDLAAAIAATSPRKQPKQGGNQVLLQSWGGSQSDCDDEGTAAAQQEGGRRDSTKDEEIDSLVAKDGLAASSPNRQRQGILKQPGTTVFNRGSSSSLSPRLCGHTALEVQAAATGSPRLVQPASPGGLQSPGSPAHSLAGSRSPQPTARATQLELGTNSVPAGTTFRNINSSTPARDGNAGSPDCPVWERHHAQHADPTAPTQSQVSRSAVLCALRLLRDLNEVAARESTARRQGSGGGPGSMRQFLASLLDLRAVLAGLLHEMRLLPLMVDMYRWVQTRLTDTSPLRALFSELLHSSTQKTSDITALCLQLACTAACCASCNAGEPRISGVPERSCSPCWRPLLPWLPVPAALTYLHQEAEGGLVQGGWHCSYRGITGRWCGGERILCCHLGWCLEHVTC